MDEDEPSTSSYYRPAWSDVDDDGAIHLHVSGYEGHESWCGSMTVNTDHRNYFFWAWLVSDPVLAKGVKTEAEIAVLKQRFLEQLSA